MTGAFRSADAVRRLYAMAGTGSGIRTGVAMDAAAGTGTAGAACAWALRVRRWTKW